MKMISSHLIRRRITVLLLLTSCSVLIFATAGFAISDWIGSRGEAVSQLRSQAVLIGNNSAAALLFKDQVSASDTLASLRTEESIMGAYLYDRDKNLFSSFQRGDNRPFAAWPQQESGYVNSVLYVAHEVQWDNETVGYLILQSKLDSWKKKQFEHLKVVTLLFLLALVIAAIIANEAQKIITNPILKLASTVRNITRTRDYQLRAEKDSNDELGELADDFNEMLNQIQQRDNELQQARDNLEEKVNERTAELIRLAEKLEHQAFHDPLTGLANRAELDERLQSAIALSRRQHSRLAVFFLDLDRFKGINDSLGHDIGDQLLIEVGQRLQSCLRSSDTLARLGGDEFAVLAHNTDPDAAAEIACKLIEAVNQPIDVNNYSLQVTTSIGVSLYPDDGDTAPVILKNADTAMYNSKEAGRNQFSFYAKAMNERTERRLLLEGKLRKAVRNQAFEVFYQPKWDIRGDKVIGLEALVRWPDEDEGYISPAEFIPLAEDSGLVCDIDTWVLKTACEQLQSLYGERPPEVHLSVNFSPVHFLRLDVASQVTELVEQIGFPPEKLELEITETVIASEVNEVYQQLSALRELGVEISIDDFGIAYSSLSRLKQLPLNTLKIDRSFIQDIGRDKDDEVIVRTIIDMAHNLNLKVVAEGVETQEQLNFVSAHHCDAVQGFLFSRPVPLAELPALLNLTESVN